MANQELFDASSPVGPEKGSMPTVEQLPQKLGFVETEEMARLRQLWTEALTAGAEQAGELRAQYESLAMDLIGAIEDDGYTKAVIGLNIATSLVWRGSGNPERYIQELEDVQEQLANEGNMAARPVTEWGFQDVYDCVVAEITHAKQAPYNNYSTRNL